MISLENTENFWVMVLAETKCLGNTTQNEAQTKWKEVSRMQCGSISQPKQWYQWAPGTAEAECGPGDTYETGGRVGQLGADVAVWLLLSHYGNTCSLLYSAEVVNLSAELQCCHIRECAPLIFCLGWQMYSKSKIIWTAGRDLELISNEMQKQRLARWIEKSR